MANEIGKAYLAVLPQLDSDFESTLGSMVADVPDQTVFVTPEISGGGDAIAGEVQQGVEESAGLFEAAGADAGGSLIAGLATAVGVGVAAGGVAFAGLSALGLQFNKSRAVLRGATGDTGDDLKGLQDIANNIFASSPAALADISGTVALAHVELGLVGDDLQTVSTRIVQLARVTGSDLPGLTDDVTAMFNLWHIGSEDQEGVLDKLLRAHQATGIGVDELTGQMVGSGLQLQALGFTYDDSIALISNLSKSGLDMATTTAAFRKALTEAAKAGKPANEVFRETFDAIKNAPDDTTAAGIAVENFGARGVIMAKAIRDGQFAWEDLAAEIQDGDTVKKAASEVGTFAGKFEILKHKAELAFEPIGSGIADTLNGIGGFVGDVWNVFQKEGWQAAWEKIAATAGFIWDGDPASGIEGIHQKLNRFLEGIPGWALEAAGVLAGIGGTLFAGLVGWAESIWEGDPETGREGLHAKLNRAIEAFPGWVEEKGTQVSAWAAGLIDSVLGWADKLWDGDDEHEGLKTKLDRLIAADGPFITWISEQPAKLGLAVQGWPAAIVHWATTLWDGDPETGTTGIHQGLEKLVDDLTQWVDEVSGEEMWQLGLKLWGGMMLGGLMALKIGIDLLGKYTLTALRFVFLGLIPMIFDIGHSIGRAMLRGFVDGFLHSIPGPLLGLLKTAPGVGPIISEMEIASQILEHDEGGMVGAAFGAPTLAVVHGGERVLTAQQNADLGLGTGFAPRLGGASQVVNIGTIVSDRPEPTAREVVLQLREERWLAS